MAITVDQQQLRETIDELVDELHLPGLGVGVVRGGETVFAEGFGFADIESERPHTMETRQRIGSITKTMVAFCAMALVEEHLGKTVSGTAAGRFGGDGSFAMDDATPAEKP